MSLAVIVVVGQLAERSLVDHGLDDANDRLGFVPLSEIIDVKRRWTLTDGVADDRGFRTIVVGEVLRWRLIAVDIVRCSCWFKRLRRREVRRVNGDGLVQKTIVIRRRVE